MFENSAPFRSEPFSLTSPYRPIVMTFDNDGEEKEPLGYVTEASNNFDQTNSSGVEGGNYYFNLDGDSASDRSGLIFIFQNTNNLIIHPDESWSEPIDQYHEKDIHKAYGVVEVRLEIKDRYEFHIPFKNVKYKWKFKKQTRVYKSLENSEDPFELELISDETEDEEFEFTLPDDFDQGKHAFRSYELTLQEKIDRGFIHPGKGTGEFFHDDDEKYAIDNVSEERFYTIDSDGRRTSLDRIERTEIDYLLSDPTEVTETVTPSAFFNQDL